MAPVAVPWATVIIPTYGQGGVSLVDNCLRSLRLTHGAASPEVLVVSDGDEQSVLELLEAVCAQHDARLIAAARGGFAHACNAGIDQANGGYGVFLVNNDIEFIEPSLLMMSDAFNNLLGAGVVGCRLLYPDMTIQHGGVVWLPGEGRPHGFFDHRYRFESAILPQALCAYPSLVTGALMGLSRWHLDTTGPLDTRFGFAVEDIDACLSCIEAGRNSIYLGYTAAIHHEGKTRGRTLEEKQSRFPELIAKEEKALADLHEKWAGFDWSVFR